MKTEQAPDSRSLAILNSWARGCDHCTFGLIDPAPPTLPIPLYILRAFHLQFGVLALCDCKAGQAYERYLLRVWQDVLAKGEHIPDTWSTAIHRQIQDMLRPPRMEGIEPAHAEIRKGEKVTA